MKQFSLVTKFLRYISLYGPLRSLVKAAYHLNNEYGNIVLKFLFRVRENSSSDRIFIAGLGNHGFTLITYGIALIGRRSIHGVIDPSSRAQYLAKNILRCEYYRSLKEAVDSGNFFGDILYICSDHKSHMSYALAAKNCFSSVYIEKPLIVSPVQVPDLLELAASDVNVFTGFNRPHAPFTRRLIEYCGDVFNITFVVNGHFLPPDHWYRDENQGSRILGNLTHWLDLSYRLFMHRDNTTSIDIALLKGHLDDVTIVLRQSNRTINICFSANSEPLDGVEEFVYWNSITSIGLINNFRKFTSYNGLEKIILNRMRKDVGHIQTVLMPFNDKANVDKIFVSSALFCLHVEEMYLMGIPNNTFSPGKVKN